jgi:hypothetical protein
MISRSFQWLLFLILLTWSESEAFTSPRPTLIDWRRTNHVLLAKKSSGKGFGKVQESKPSPASSSTDSDSPAASQATAGTQSSTLPGTSQSPFLQSIDNRSSADEPSDDPEERAKRILREQYGLKTLEEQQLSAQQLARRKEEQTKWAELKKKAESNEDLDLFSLLPAPILVGIDRFLKAGVVVCSILFVLAGLLITVEAWSKTSGDPLPPDLDAFIVNTVEPNFTPGLLVLLSFSVGLGGFAALQLGSRGATYKENE